MSEKSKSATPSASGPDKTIRRQLLEEAADLIDNDRNDTYGPPTENFANIAELWNIRFKHLLKDGARFTGSDYADAMILVKVARGISQKTHDGYADIAGYAGCGEEIRQDEEKSGLKKRSRNITINQGHIMDIHVNTPPGPSAGAVADAIAYEIRQARRYGGR